MGIFGPHATWGACWRQLGWAARPRAPPWTRGHCPPRSLLSPRGPSLPCILGVGGGPSPAPWPGAPAAHSEAHLPAFPTSNSPLSTPTPSSGPKGLGGTPGGLWPLLGACLAGLQGSRPSACVCAPTLRLPGGLRACGLLSGRVDKRPCVGAAARAEEKAAEEGRPAAQLAPGFSLLPGPASEGRPHTPANTRRRADPQSKKGAQGRPGSSLPRTQEARRLPDLPPAHTEGLACSGILGGRVGSQRWPCGQGPSAQAGGSQMTQRARMWVPLREPLGPRATPTCAHVLSHSPHRPGRLLQAPHSLSHGSL